MPTFIYIEVESLSFFKEDVLTARAFAASCSVGPSSVLHIVGGSDVTGFDIGTDGQSVSSCSIGSKEARPPRPKGQRGGPKGQPKVLGQFEGENRLAHRWMLNCSIRSIVFSSSKPTLQLKKD